MRDDNITGYKKCRVYDFNRWYDGKLIQVYTDIDDDDNDLPVSESTLNFVVCLTKEECDKYSFPKAMCIMAKYPHVFFLNTTEDREIYFDMTHGIMPDIFSRRDN